MKIIVGITGASGALYGLELLRRLKAAGEETAQKHEVHAVVSDYGWKVLEHECGVRPDTIRSLVHTLHDNTNIGDSIASGSFRVDCMVVCPCSMRTLAAIANGLADNLLCRAADVVLKERGNLVLAVRETPLNAIHLENMLKLARAGAGIMPLCPGFYHKPQSMEDIAAMMACRILDSLGVEHEAIFRWQGQMQGQE